MSTMKETAEATSTMVQDKLDKTLDELTASREKLRLTAVSEQLHHTSLAWPGLSLLTQTYPYLFLDMTQHPWSSGG